MEFSCREVEIVLQMEVGLSIRSIEDRREVFGDQSCFRLVDRQDSCLRLLIAYGAF